MACNRPAQPAAPRAIPAPEESTSGGGLIGSGPKAIVAGVPMPAEVAGVELIEAVEVIAMRVLEFVRVMSRCALRSDDTNVASLRAREGACTLMKLRRTWLDFATYNGVGRRFPFVWPFSGLDSAAAPPSFAPLPLENL